MDILQTGLDGLHVAESKLNRAASQISKSFLSLDEPQDVVDLSTEAVALMTAKHAFETNLKLIETADELQQSTLDILG
jgi:flagellar hook protein FlgE